MTTTDKIKSSLQEQKNDTHANTHVLTPRGVQFTQTHTVCSAPQHCQTLYQKLRGWGGVNKTNGDSQDLCL